MSPCIYSNKYFPIEPVPWKIFFSWDGDGLPHRNFRLLQQHLFGATGFCSSLQILTVMMRDQRESKAEKEKLAQNTSNKFPVSNSTGQLVLIAVHEISEILVLPCSRWDVSLLTCFSFIQKPPHRELSPRSSGWSPLAKWDTVPSDWEADTAAVWSCGSQLLSSWAPEPVLCNKSNKRWKPSHCNERSSLCSNKESPLLQQQDPNTVNNEE